MHGGHSCSVAGCRQQPLRIVEGEKRCGVHSGARKALGPHKPVAVRERRVVSSDARRCSKISGSAAPKRSLAKLSKA